MGPRQAHRASSNYRPTEHRWAKASSQSVKQLWVNRTQMGKAQYRQLTHWQKAAIQLFPTSIFTAPASTAQLVIGDTGFSRQCAASPLPVCPRSTAPGLPANARLHRSPSVHDPHLSWVTRQCAASPLPVCPRSTRLLSYLPMRHNPPLSSSARRRLLWLHLPTARPSPEATSPTSSAHNKS